MGSPSESCKAGRDRRDLSSHACKRSGVKMPGSRGEGEPQGSPRAAAGTALGWQQGLHLPHTACPARSNLLPRHVSAPTYAISPKGESPAWCGSTRLPGICGPSSKDNRFPGSRQGRWMVPQMSDLRTRGPSASRKPRDEHCTEPRFRLRQR